MECHLCIRQMTTQSLTFASTRRLRELQEARQREEGAHAQQKVAYPQGPGVEPNCGVKPKEGGEALAPRGAPAPREEEAEEEEAEGEDRVSGVPADRGDGGGGGGGVPSEAAVAEHARLGEGAGTEAQHEAEELAARAERGRQEREGVAMAEEEARTREVWQKLKR